MKRVAINQSNYVPWKGYFDLIHDVDIFLFYDDIQFTIRNWRNRNKIKTQSGLIWLTIPVGNNRNRLICEVKIDDKRWQSKHLKTLNHFYCKAPFFKDYQGFLEEIYLKNEWNDLSKLNQFIIQKIAKDYLGIKTVFLHSSDFSVYGHKQDRLINLLKSVKADIYISGPAANAYLEPERFKQESVELIWKDYSGYPEYPQFYPPFEHQVSIFDLLFHTGPRAPYYIWGWREENKNIEAKASG